MITQAPCFSTTVPLRDKQLYLRQGSFCLPLARFFLAVHAPTTAASIYILLDLSSNRFL